MAAKSMGIVKALKIISSLDVETLKAIEEVQAHYSNMPGVVTGLRIMREHRMMEETDDSPI